MSLRKKTLAGLSWSSFSQLMKQVSQFIILAILARLLSPNDFGLMGMALVFIEFITIFNEMGVSSALIQKQDIHERHFSSVFWFNIAVGVLLMGITIVCAPLVAWFYDQPVLQGILVVLSVNYVIASFIVVQKTIFQKNMDFKSITLAETLALIIAGIVGIYFAFQGHGVWSLVYQMLAFTTTNMILLWLLQSQREDLYSQ